MAEEESAPSGSLEDPEVPAQDSAVPDPSGARQDAGTQDAIDDATQSAKDDIADALAEADEGAQQPAEDAQDQ
jgi:hypothetical protein